MNKIRVKGNTEHELELHKGTKIVMIVIVKVKKWGRNAGPIYI